MATLMSPDSFGINSHTLPKIFSTNVDIGHLQNPRPFPPRMTKRVALNHEYSQN